jgi:hypothetical protein
MSGRGLPWNKRAAKVIIGGAGLVLLLGAQNSAARQAQADADVAAAEFAMARMLREREGRT